MDDGWMGLEVANMSIGANSANFYQVTNSAKITGLDDESLERYSSLEREYSLMILELLKII